MLSLKANATTEIRRLHQLALQAAETAVGHALRIGELLNEAKATLPHGEYQSWVTVDCGLPLRTARRYSRLAGNRAALESKAATVAGLTVRAADQLLAVKRRVPHWLPDTGAVQCGDGRGRKWFAWRIDDTFANAVSITETHDWGCLNEYLPRGIRADMLGNALVLQGLHDPDSADWQPSDFNAAGYHTALRSIDVPAMGAAA